MDIDTLSICALRYVLPRHTYMVGLICDEIGNNLGVFKNETLNIMKRDLDNWYNDVKNGSINASNYCDWRKLDTLRNKIDNVLTNNSST